MLTTLTSREFNQETSRAKRAGCEGPVFITDRGRPAHVLLSIEEYRRLAGREPSVAEVFGSAEAAGIDFDPSELKDLPQAGEFD